MRYKTVEEILQQAAVLHQQLADRIEQAAGQQQRERLGLVLTYLADHQAQLRLALDAFRREAASSDLATWFDRSPELELPRFETLSLVQAADLNTLLGQLVEFHDELGALYANLRDQACIESVRAIFGDLAALVQHEKTELIQGARQAQDY